MRRGSRLSAFGPRHAPKIGPLETAAGGEEKEDVPRVRLAGPRRRRGRPRDDSNLTRSDAFPRRPDPDGGDIKRGKPRSRRRHAARPLSAWAEDRVRPARGPAGRASERNRRRFAPKPRGGAREARLDARGGRRRSDAHCRRVHDAKIDRVLEQTRVADLSRSGRERGRGASDGGREAPPTPPPGAWRRSDTRRTDGTAPRRVPPTRPFS